ncbi:MAG TPA: aldo/keto reductase [Clostridia bacterium]|nr:aldo/keto reductase [Clostridia bacterium]
MSDDNSGKRSGFDRRDFLKIGGTATASFVAGTLLSSPARALPPLPSNAVTPKAMPTRNLGQTGYRVGVFSLGGQAAIEQPNNEAVAVPIVERALDLGVNYVDTAAAYGAPERWSQRYIGQVMKHRRAEAFLASKTHDRTRDGSLRLLDESLKLLNTDHLDLWQLHNLSRMEQVEQIFAKGGAIEALQHAREQKMVRHLGVTGHADPDVLIEMIRRFPFDTILMSLNAADKHHLSFIEKLLPMALEKQMGVIGMKIPARGRILSSWTPPAAGQQRGFEGVATRPGTLAMQEALYYVLSMPVSTVIIGCDSIAQLEQNVELARKFTPLNETQLASLVTKTEPIAKQALFFRKWS